MSNSRVASRYAKSLLDLAVEKQQLEPVYNDMLYLQDLTKQSRDFLNLLRSPVLKADTKVYILSAFKRHRNRDAKEELNILMQKGCRW